MRVYAKDVMAQQEIDPHYGPHFEIPLFTDWLALYNIVQEDSPIYKNVLDQRAQKRLKGLARNASDAMYHVYEQFHGSQDIETPVWEQRSKELFESMLNTENAPVVMQHVLDVFDRVAADILSISEKFKDNYVEKQINTARMGIVKIISLL